MNGNVANLKKQSFGLLSMLTIQFVLGMILNLFVELPKIHPGVTGNFASRAYHGFVWAISSGGGIVLVLHVLVAIGLLIGSIALVARAVAAGSKSWLSVSIVGALGVIVALTNGLAFIGYDNDVSSFVMAIGFIVAATAYSTALSFAVSPETETEAAKSAQAQHVGHRLRPTHG
jgi:hypothetical protein